MDDVLEEILLKLDDKSINTLKTVNVNFFRDIEKIEEKEEFWRKKLSNYLEFEVFDRVDNWRTMYINSVLVQKYLFGLIEFDYPEIINGLIKNGLDPTLNHDAAIRFAARKGRVNIVKVLLADPRVDPSALNNYAFSQAAAGNHLEVMQLLLSDSRFRMNDLLFIDICTSGFLSGAKTLLKDSRTDPSIRNNTAFICAAWNNHVEIVKLLLTDSRVDPTAQNNKALMKVSKEGRAETLKLLLKDPRVDPSVRQNKALENAIYHRKAEIVKLLLSDSRVDPVYQNNNALRTAIYRFSEEIITLLLSDNRIRESLFRINVRDAKILFYYFNNQNIISTQLLEAILEET